MLKSAWSKIHLQAARLNRSNNVSSRDAHHHHLHRLHHQPAYTLYHNYTSDIDIHSTPLDPPSQSYDQVIGQSRHKVAAAGHSLTAKVLAAAILTSFLVGLVLGLIIHGNDTVASPSGRHLHLAANRVTRIVTFLSL